MVQAELTQEEIVRRGEDRYNRELRDRVETPDNRGKFLALDIETGSYEIDREDLTAEERLLSRLPEATVYALRIGYPAAYRLGSQWQR